MRCRACVLTLRSAFCDGVRQHGCAGPTGAQVAPADAINRHLLQVSSSGKPLHYFVELSKRFLQEHGEVQLSAIGLAIPQAVNVSRILTTSGYATELRERLASRPAICDFAGKCSDQKRQLQSCARGRCLS